MYAVAYLGDYIGKLILVNRLCKIIVNSVADCLLRKFKIGIAAYYYDLA